MCMTALKVCQTTGMHLKLHLRLLQPQPLDSGFVLKEVTTSFAD